MAQIAHPRHVDVVESLPDGTFDGTPVTAARPVVVRGGAGAAGIARWGSEELPGRLGDRPLRTHVAADGAQARFGIGIGTRVEPMTCAQLMSALRAGEPGQARYAPYSLRSGAPEMLAEIEPPPNVPAERVTDAVLWFGSGGCRTQLHFDGLHNIYAQIEGRKRFLFFNPVDHDALYPGAFRGLPHVSGVDPAAPDLERFPRYAFAECTEALLEPGDLLFMPAFWWHQVTSLDLAVSLNLWWRPAVSDCLTPALYRQLRSDGLQRDIRPLFHSYHFPGGRRLGVLADLADGLLAVGEGEVAARLAGAAVHAGARAACRQAGQAVDAADPGAQIETVAEHSLWSASDLDIARRCAALSALAGSGAGVAAGDVADAVSGLRRVGWDFDESESGGPAPVAAG